MATDDNDNDDDADIIYVIIINNNTITTTKATQATQQTEQKTKQTKNTHTHTHKLKQTNTTFSGNPLGRSLLDLSVVVWSCLKSFARAAAGASRSRPLQQYSNLQRQPCLICLQNEHPNLKRSPKRRTELILCLPCVICKKKKKRGQRIPIRFSLGFGTSFRSNSLLARVWQLQFASRSRLASKFVSRSGLAAQIRLSLGFGTQKSLRARVQHNECCPRSGLALQFCLPHALRTTNSLPHNECGAHSGLAFQFCLPLGLRNTNSPLARVWHHEFASRSGLAPQLRFSLGFGTTQPQLRKGSAHQLQRSQRLIKSNDQQLGITSTLIAAPRYESNPQCNVPCMYVKYMFKYIKCMFNYVTCMFKYVTYTCKYVKPC